MADRKIVVQKYGGTSVADLEKIRMVAGHVKKTAKDKKVVVVVSAMGKETDKLIQLAQELYGGQPPREELDKLLVTGEEQSASLLAIAINHLGLSATSLTGREVELGADSIGKIKRIRNIQMIKDLLNQEKIVVVAGFHGVEEKTNRVVTLGRGGSDLVTIALTASLQLNYCEIYTDVDGVFNINPNIVPEARRFERISYGQMIQLSGAGAGVLMDRSVILAQNLGVTIRVLLSPSFGQTTGGTLVCSGGTLEEMEGSTWVQPGVAIQKGNLIKISNISNKPGMAEKIFEPLSDLVLMDSQGSGEERADVSLLCLPRDLPQVLERLNRVRESKEAGEIKITEGLKVAELTFVYPLMQEEPGYFYRIFKAMAKMEVNIVMHFAAGTAISVVVKEKDLEKAALALGEEFKLLKAN